MKRNAIAVTLALLIGVPGGWIAAMLLTPVLWDLEPVLHMELAGHSGPSDWIFYVVWAVVVPLLFVFFRWIFRGRQNRSNDRFRYSAFLSNAVREVIALPPLLSKDGAPRRVGSGFTGHIPVAFPKGDVRASFGKATGKQDTAMRPKKDVQQGTLALMVLKTLDVIGPLHGWGIARRIEQISGDLLALNQGTLYPVLLRLEQEGAIASEWGPSENNRRARYYRLTRAGHKMLETEKRDWEQTAAIIARFFEVKAEDLA